MVGNFNNEEIQIIEKLPIKEFKYIAINRQINILKDISAFFGLVKYFRKNKFNVTHSVSPKAGLLNALASKYVGVDNRIHIFTGQVWANKTGFSRFILKTFDKIIVMCSTQILIDGQSQKDYLIEQKIVSAKNSVVFGKGSIAGVNLQRFKFDPQTRTELRAKLKINESTVVFLFLGRLNRDKGIYDLIKAFEKIQSQQNDFCLLLVGYDEEHIHSGINNTAVNSKKIIFRPPTLEPENFYSASDIFCLPSYREGFGSSVIEASSCELPVICSNVYGLKDTIVDYVTGLRFEAGNINELAELMLKLATNKTLRAEMGRNGFDYVSQNFDYKLVTQYWLEFYNNLLSAKK